MRVIRYYFDVIIAIHLYRSYCAQLRESRALSTSFKQYCAVLTFLPVSRRLIIAQRVSFFLLPPSLRRDPLITVFLSRGELDDGRWRAGARRPGDRRNPVGLPTINLATRYKRARDNIHRLFPRRASLFSPFRLARRERERERELVLFSSALFALSRTLCASASSCLSLAGLRERERERERSAAAIRVARVCVCVCVCVCVSMSRIAI